MKEESKNSWFFANVCHYEDTRHCKEIGQFLGNDSARFASSDIIQRRWQVSIHWRISHQLLEHKRTKKKKKVVKNLSSLLTKDSMHFFPPVKITYVQQFRSKLSQPLVLYTCNSITITELGCSSIKLKTSLITKNRTHARWHLILNSPEAAAAHSRWSLLITRRWDYFQDLCLFRIFVSCRRTTRLIPFVTIIPFSYFPSSSCQDGEIGGTCVRHWICPLVHMPFSHVQGGQASRFLLHYWIAILYTDRVYFMRLQGRKRLPEFSINRSPRNLLSEYINNMSLSHLLLRAFFIYRSSRVFSEHTIL